jgi:D-proline reductase (dithiol) PrdB
MKPLSRHINQGLARLTTRIPVLGRKLTRIATLKEKIPGLPVPRFVLPSRPLSDIKIALVTTSGVHHSDQEPFDMSDPHGDPSSRVIDTAHPKQDLIITHDYYDHRDADVDINIVLPLDRAREIRDKGLIGLFSRYQYSFMGHITGPHVSTLIHETGPRIAKRLQEEMVEAVLLTPGWGICNRSVGLIQRVIEAHGIPTVGISIDRRMTEIIKPSRTVYVNFPFGHPLGEPFNIAQQTTVLMAALRALYDIRDHGRIIDLPFIWGKEEYDLENAYLGRLSSREDTTA